MRALFQSRAHIAPAAAYLRLEQLAVGKSRLAVRLRPRDTLSSALATRLFGTKLLKKKKKFSQNVPQKPDV